jgi:hypothetical protein
VVDVDFEKVVTNDSAQEQGDDDEEEEPYLEPPKTLLDMSFDTGDPRWKDTRIPFCRGDEYIDAKLAFMVDLEGVSYGIAMPFDDAVAIVKQTPLEDDDVKITYIDPDKYDAEDDSQELMEMMAKQVKENLGEHLVLRKTPKVLTISGGLSEITDNWEQELVDKPVSVEELLKDDDNVDKDVAAFYEFMRQELGQEEFEKTMQEEMSDEDKELANLFEAALGDIDSLDDLVAEQEKVVEEARSFHPDTDGVALKLIGFEFADRSKSYQLVKLLQPYPLVGKRIIEDAEQGVRFELLTADEEKVLIPRLEELCREDLTKAGLSLTPEE